MHESTTHIHSDFPVTGTIGTTFSRVPSNFAFNYPAEEELRNGVWLPSARQARAAATGRQNHCIEFAHLILHRN
jgi:hypothetical protein